MTTEGTGDHTPVLQQEVLLQLKPQANDVLLDATIGLGGHAAAYLTAAADSRVIGLDADAKALAGAQSNLQSFGDRVTYVHSNFAQLKKVCAQSGVASVSHILFDLGVGSHQLADDQRGFSFRSAGPLVMRYGQITDLPASHLEEINNLTARLGNYPDALDLIAGLRVPELARVISHYGEEHYAGRISRAIKGLPQLPKMATELAQTIARAVPARYEKGRIHPATRTFQALRLAVNRELETLSQALPQALEVLSGGGKLAVISFHSLEDRIVKNFMRREARDCLCDPRQVVCICQHKARLKIITKKPITASAEELAANPRARSAKMRVAMKKPT